MEMIASGAQRGLAYGTDQDRPFYKSSGVVPCMQLRSASSLVLGPDTATLKHSYLQQVHDKTVFQSHAMGE